MAVPSADQMHLEELIVGDGSVLLPNWWEAQGEMLEGYAAGTGS